MEPRPPKTTRPVTSPAQPVFTPPPVPTSERLAARSARLDDQPPTAPSPPRDEHGAIDPAAAPTIGSSEARTVWYDPSAEAAPGTEQPAAPRSPLSPVVSPRGERRSRFLGPLLAALLLVLVVGGAAFAVDKARDGNDERNAADATHTAQAAALAATPAATVTTAAQVVSTPTATAALRATDTTAPTQAQAPAEAATPTKRTATRTATVKTSGLRAPDFLPEASDLPDGFEQTANDKYTKDEMIAQLGENGADLVDQWKWRENAYRYFEIPASADPDPKAASQVTVSVHRFANKSGATAALKGLVDIVVAGGYQEVDVEKIGDQARALTLENGDGHTYVLYVRTGNFVIRLGGFSVSGDASDVVIALAKKIVNG
ncbi:MAG TPA: hypothetical protein VH482_14970 [Thermomicrobiales bacterium]|jgi:hypothetical protein